jgi:hypothetical protein
VWDFPRPLSPLIRSRNYSGMDGIDLLRQQALANRNTAIQAARREYHAAVKEINALASKLNLKPQGRPRKRLPAGDPNLKATTVAREILREGKPMSLVELTIEVQRRGCRPLDDPRAVAHAIRSGLAHCRREFKRDENGRWQLVSLAANSSIQAAFVDNSSGGYTSYPSQGTSHAALTPYSGFALPAALWLRE